VWVSVFVENSIVEEEGAQEELFMSNISTPSNLSNIQTPIPKKRAINGKRNTKQFSVVNSVPVSNDHGTNRTILILNIPPTETMLTIRSYFAKFGVIESDQVLQSQIGSWNMSVTYLQENSAILAAGCTQTTFSVQILNAPVLAPTNNLDQPSVGEQFESKPEEDDCFEAVDGHSFENYLPLHYTGGQQHPGDLVQSSSLSGAHPPPIEYELHLPNEVRTID
jgi:hypothetical protein